MRVAGIDVGGTAVKVVRWDDGVVDGGSVPTPRDDPSGAGTAELIASIVADGAPVEAVGVAVPGIVDDAAGVCRTSVNLGWRDVPIGALVAERLGLPVVVTHDVRAGAVAERLTGAGAGRAGGLLFAPVGTGLALASVDEAGLPIGTAWAGEVGQLRYAAGPHQGLRVEEIASAGGLARRFGVVEASAVLAAKQAGDARAAALWTETVEALAEVLAWAVALTAPGTVVVGGGLARAGDALLDPLRAALATRMAWFPEPALVPATHGTAAAAIGAARLAVLAAARAGRPAS